MSTLKVAKILGHPKTNYSINIPQPNKLIVLGTLKTDSIRNQSDVIIFNPDTSGNITLSTNLTSNGTITSTALTCTGKFNIPVWTTSTRPTTGLVNGIIGFNTDSGTGFEVYNTSSGWANFVGSEVLPTGLSSDSAFDRVVDIKIAYPQYPTGWYWVKIGGVPMRLWVDMDYDGGGWTLVASHPINVSIPATTYANGIGTRTTTSSSTYATGDPKSYSLFIGLQTWDAIVSANNAGRNFVYYTAGSQVGLGGSHSRRSRWKWNGWNTSYAWINPNSLSNEVGGTTPGLWGYTGYNFSTYDNDQDTYSGNCPAAFNNSPWWYNACWDGNFWGGNGSGYANAAFWTGSGGDYYTYGAYYVK